MSSQKLCLCRMIWIGQLTIRFRLATNFNCNGAFRFKLYLVDGRAVSDAERCLLVIASWRCLLKSYVCAEWFESVNWLSGLGWQQILTVTELFASSYTLLMGVLFRTQNAVELEILLFVNKQTFKENLLSSVPSSEVWWTSALKISSIQSIHGSSGRIVYGGIFFTKWAENPYCCNFFQIRCQRLSFCYWLSICVL